MTFLLIFFVLILFYSNYLQTDGVNNDQPDATQFSIWHEKGKGEQAQLAAEFGPVVLKGFEDFFNKDFPLPKLDMGAVPDFDAGAMENWGLILYRATRFLYDENESALADKYEVTRIISHEISHQWFGNLVTMKYWDDLWLNEGFASYMEHVGADFYDDAVFQSLDRVITDETQLVMQDDGYTNSKAISSPIQNPEYEVTFSSVIYSKGASLVKMMVSFLGEENFFDGIRLYLDEYEFNNAGRQDLFSVLDRVAEERNLLPDDLTMAQIMQKWTEDPGYPVLTVTDRTTSGGILGRTTSLRLQQNRFLFSSSDSSSYWNLPISFCDVDAASPDDCKLVFMRSSSLNFNLLADYSDTPYILNFGQSGYFRVNYDRKNWDDLVALMKTQGNTLDRQIRSQLYDDAFNLAHGGLLDYEVPLELAKALKQEKDFIPLSSFSRALSYLDDMLRADDKLVYPLLKEFVRDLLRDNYDELGFDSTDDYITSERQNLVLRWMCLYGETDCIVKARASFHDWLTAADPDIVNPIDINLRQTIYEVAVREGGEEEFNFLLERLPFVKVDGETLNILRGLGATLDPDLIRGLLDLTLDDESPIRQQGIKTYISTYQIFYMSNIKQYFYDYFF
jgi:aminopeptidase N